MVYKRVEELKDLVNSDPFRLYYHIMPPVGLLNDPNGFVFYKGKYHIFYQWNPLETAHGPKYWGHYISDDLVHWKEAPFALAPDQWYDKNGCYSGSAVVHEDKLYLFYTGNVINEEGNRESYQCLAVSDDGIHFEKKGPVVYLPKGYTAHFRDPKVFFNNNQWHMVLGAQTEDLQGEVVVFTSSDLLNWSFQGPLTGSGHNGLQNFGYMWECPDLFRLDNVDILIVCPQGLKPDGYKYNNIYQSGYFAGTVNYKTLSYEHNHFEELDRGFDFYAPQTTVDAEGRRLLFGWMGNADNMQHPTEKYGWIHALTIPRELKWKKGKLFQQPVKEMKSLRGTEVIHKDVVVDRHLVKLPQVEGQVFELEVVVKDFKASHFSIKIGEFSKITFDQKASLFTFERKRIDGDGTVEKRHCVLENVEGIHIFKDTSSLEIFINGGEEVFTSRVYDNLENEEIAFSAENGNVKIDISKWDLKKVFS